VDAIPFRPFPISYCSHQWFNPSSPKSRIFYVPFFFVLQKKKKKEEEEEEEEIEEK
jgi:hypothetical protein